MISKEDPGPSQCGVELKESFESDWEIGVAQVASDVPTSITFALAKARCNSSAFQGPAVPSKE